MKQVVILLLACVFLNSCGNQARNNAASKPVEPSYTMKDTADIVKAIFSYQDSAGESFITHMESAPLDTISFIKNDHYNHPISFPTSKIVQYISPPEGYPRHAGRSDELDISFSAFEIQGDSARCVMISKYMSSIGDYGLKKIQGNWKVNEFIDIRF